MTKDIFYLITNDGLVLKYDAVAKRDTVIYNLKLDKLETVSSAAVSSDNKYLVIGNGMGTVYILDLQKDKMNTEFSITSSNVKQVLFDYDNSRLTVMCPDNFLNIYKFGEFTKRPISFSPIGDKMIEVVDFGTKILGITKNKLFWVYPNAQSYADVILKHITRNFTQREWNMFMRNLIPKYDIVKQN